MRNQRDKRNYIIIGLCAILVIMGVGYASFSTLLTINGTANISNSWCLGFDNTKTNTMQVTKGVSTGANPTGSMSYSGTACSTTLQPNASLSATFHQPGDQIEYTLTIKNASTVTAAIKSILVDNESVTSNTTRTKDNITYVINMPLDTTLSANEETTMTIIAKVQNETPISGVYTGETKTINVKINAEQDDGNGGFTPIAGPYTGDVYAINTDFIYKDTSTLQDLGTIYNSCSATGKNSCLKYTIENDIVTGAEVCFIKGGIERCLKGWVDECIFSNNSCTFAGTQTVFNSNKSVLQSAFTEANACFGNISCQTSDWDAGCGADGGVSATDKNGYWYCYISKFAACDFWYGYD